MKRITCLIVVMAMLTVIPAWTQETERVIRATAFVVEDDQGRERAKLGMTSEGPGLLLYDEDGNCRFAFETVDDVTYLMMVDENGAARLMLSVTEYGSALVIYDENRKIIWKEQYPILE